MMFYFDHGLKDTRTLYIKKRMSVRLWNNGFYSIFAQKSVPAVLEPESSEQARMRLDVIPENENETEPEPVSEADGQFSRIWNVTPVSESRAVCVESAAFEVTQETQIFTVMLPLAVSVSKINFMFREENLGDSLYMDVASESVVGTVTATADAGDTVVSVSDTAAETFFGGSSIVLDTTRYTVTSVDMRRGNVRISPPLAAAVEEGAKTGFSVPVMKGFVVLRTGDYEMDIGNRFLPQSCPITLVYTNRTEAKKICFMTIEYTT